MPKQNFANHTKTFPPFHFFVLPMLLINLGTSVYWLVAWGWKGNHPFAIILGVLMSLALIAGFLSARIFALTVQDRVIRLEERIRMASLLSDPLKAKSATLTERQIIAIRFASDAELPALVDKALAGDSKPKDIKAAIQTWRPDYWRV